MEWTENVKQIGDAVKTVLDRDVTEISQAWDEIGDDDLSLTIKIKLSPQDGGTTLKSKIKLSFVKSKFSDETEFTIDSD